MPNIQNVNTFTDYGAEQQDIDRRRKLAELLQQQALTPIEQQTAGGQVIPISWTQLLAKGLQGGVGVAQERALKDEQKALGSKMRTEATDWLGTMPQPTETPMAGSAADSAQFNMAPQMEQKAPTQQQMMAWALRGGMSGNPLAAQMATPFMTQALKANEPFNLRADEKRYGPNGQVLAANEKVPNLHFGNTGTAIQGFDQRTGMPVGPATTVQPAPLAQDPNKPFMPDGSPNPAFQSYQAQLRREGAPKVSVTVPVNTEKKYGEAFASKIADADVSLRDAAEKAPQLAERANRIKQVLASGNAITGFGADFRLGFGKAAALAGLESAKDAAANTETLAAGLAQNTMDAIKASGMGGGTGFSNADRDFLEKAVGGKITLEPQAIGRLADLAHRAAALTADRWTKRAAQIPKSAIEGTGVDTSPVRVPPLGAEQAPTAPGSPAAPGRVRRYNPATQSLE